MKLDDHIIAQHNQKSAEIRFNAATFVKDEKIKLLETHAN